jgi:hypothetical protein
MSPTKIPVNELLGELYQLAEGFDRFLYSTDINEQGLSSHEPTSGDWVHGIRISGR